MRSGDQETRQVSSAIRANLMHFPQHASVLRVGPRKIVRYVWKGKQMPAVYVHV